MGDEESSRRIRDNVMGELKKMFRPEFLNRVDDTIVFRQLNEEDIRLIARRMIASLDRRVNDLELTLTVSDEAVAELARAGFDPVYGARPLRRAIQSRIEDPLAEKLLEGEFRAGDMVAVDFCNGELVFQKTEP